MKVQEYLRKHGLNGLEKLQEEFSIIVGDYPDRISLNYNQIDSPRFHPICDECRGLILRKDTWKVIARSFDRFYNIGESINDKDFPIAKAYFLEKLDGSLLNCSHDDKEWCLSTRKMAYAEGMLPIGITFRQLFDDAVKNTNLWEWLESTPVKNISFIFELTSPENRIVTPYTKREVTLIGARNNDTENELKTEELDSIAKEMGIKRPKLFKFSSIEETVKAAEKLNIMDEGFVLLVENKEGSHRRLKCKNSKYVAIAHMRSNGQISPKRIMTLLITNEHIEYLNYFPEDKHYFDFAENIYKESLSRINYIVHKYMFIKEQKEFALTIMPFTEYAYEKGIIFNARKGVPVEESIIKMGGKKISEALGLRNKFAKEFGVIEEGEENEES